MTMEDGAALELGDIQAGALMPRPNPYAGAYLALRIGDRQAGRELLRRLILLLDPVATFDPARPVSLAVALSFAGLQALGVPEESLATFPAEFQQGMDEQAADRAEQDWLAAKMVGRWPSGAPLALCPDKDDPELSADPERNNAFLNGDDPRGLKCPLGSHARRMNARDSVITGKVRLHRMIGRGTNYGPSLPRGVLEDDGADRGLMFAFVGAHLDRQFEFVQRQWLNDGEFIGAPAETDPLIGGFGNRQFTIPNRPIRRRLQGLPAFVVNRGGEYCFMPGLRALGWLADPGT